MAIRAVAAFHVRSGRYPQLFEALRSVKRFVERGGGTLIVSREVFGPQAGNIIAIGQYPDWGAFAKVRSDPEFQSFLETIRNNPDPAADIVVSAVFEEVTI